MMPKIACAKCIRIMTNTNRANGIVIAWTCPASHLNPVKTLVEKVVLRLPVFADGSRLLTIHPNNQPHDCWG